MGDLKPGWKRVKFGELAECVNDRVHDPASAGVERYVGLDHLDPESLTIRRWGAPEEVESTKLRFGPGDIIFGKRRAYQRKLAVADFAGICSAHAMVLRARPRAVAPGFLPFFMQSDVFMDRAVAISVGSLSPTINWKTLAAEEFALPPLEEQRRIELILRSFEAQYESTRALEFSQRNLFRSALDALYSGQLSAQANRTSRSASEAVTPSHWSTRQLGDVCSIIRDGVHKRPTYVERGIPFITVENLTRGPELDLSTTRFVTPEDHAQFTKRAKPEFGDVLISKDGATLGVARVIETHAEFSIFVSVALMKPVREVLDGHFLRYFFDCSLFRRVLQSKVSGSALPHIHLVDLRATRIPVPPLDEQRKVAGVIRGLENGARAAGAHRAGSLLAKRLVSAELLS